ncbi:hypothetical protein N799_13385 [Lysobacter arseniciresistens ZS79]|uniref:Uncharacterized protein n=1 Tax=Lysobacter arseniciresistens ZS79 TaxID=913325 RepID=A0A0A0F149_9GAMM|nr:hypothetical protein N799_13385 [Lysobacter arseniciresistens ZS79]
MPIVGIDVPVIHRASVMVILHNQAILITVISIAVVGSAAAHHHIRDIYQHPGQGILRLSLA